MQSIILLIFLILFFTCCYFYYLYRKEKERKDKIEEINNSVYKKKEKIEKEIEEISNKLNILKDKKNFLQEQINEKNKDLDIIKNSLNNSTEISREAFENYNNVLNEEYKKIEEEMDAAINLLNQSYELKQDELLAEIGSVRTDLDKISATRAAALQAQLREEEIQQQAEFYSLSIDEVDKREVRVLQSIESELRDPRPIRMIIWQAYYSKRANELAARVLGSDEVCGIYKITNKINKMCYIGQAKKMRERWREHMKCGLGIDTPANNKLYIAMKKDGIDNFTFELLETCAAADLDTKETFYINLYDSYNFGYNSNTGNKKS